MAFGKQKARTFAVGDIHGCAAELEALLERIRPTKLDRFVFLGDYVDRGPASRRVIDLIIDLDELCEVIALKGNHEAMFLDFLERPESSGAGLFILNGGSATLASYSTGDGSFEIPETHINFLRNLRLTFETDTHFFVHAGVPLQLLSTIDLKMHEEQLLWSRHPFLSTDFRWEKVIVHGHTPAPEPERKPNRINLDTGCVYGGMLTAIELPEGRFHQVARGTKVAPLLFPLDSKKKDTPAHARIALRFSGRLPVVISRPNGAKHKFETLNYNQFGLLLTEKDISSPGQSAAGLEVGEHIEGSIGSGENLILFSGSVVRIDTRGEHANYGVRIERISNDDSGNEWINRPPDDDSDAD
jgi:serine/threonine protein phosphatase 1